MPLWIIPMQALTPYPTSKDTMLTVPRFLCEPCLVNLFPLKDSCDFVHPFRASLRAPCGICQLKCSSELEYEWNSDSDRQSKRKNMSALFSTNFAKLPPLHFASSGAPRLWQLCWGLIWRISIRELAFSLSVQASGLALALHLSVSLWITSGCGSIQCHTTSVSRGRCRASSSAVRRGWGGGLQLKIPTVRVRKFCFLTDTWCHFRVVREPRGIICCSKRKKQRWHLKTTCWLA